MEIISIGIHGMKQSCTQRAATLWLSVILLFGLLQIVPAAKGFATVTAKNLPKVSSSLQTGGGAGDADISILGLIPTILVDTAGVDMSAFEITAAGESHIESYYVDFADFNIGDLANITVDDPSGSFTISFSSGSGYAKSLDIVISSSLDMFMVWIKYAPTTAGPHTATITHTGDGAEPVTFGMQGDTPVGLPVELISFKARVEKESIVLDWTTASETNNSHFEIEMTQNPAASFQQVGSVASKATNSVTVINYTFRHTYRDIGGTYYFRLKQIDIDQSFSYSNIIAISTRATAGIKLQVAPNPVTEVSQLSIRAAVAGGMEVIVTDINGTAVFRQSCEVSSGENLLPLSLPAALPAGIYILTATTASGASRLRLVKK